MDAMIFELLLASRRMITQSRDTERTQRDDTRRAVGATAPLETFAVRAAPATDAAAAGADTTESPAGAVA